MSISGALNNALSGLSATARMAEVVSSNLSNALTDGYGRRQVDLSAATIGGNSSGVRVDGISRISDVGVLADRRLADANVGSNTRSAVALQEIERDFGQVGDPTSIGGRLAQFETSLISAAADPASELRLGAVVGRLADLTATIKNNANSIRGQRESADAAIAQDVGTLNAALAQVERLNADISRARGAGIDTSSLYDARQRAIDSISGIVPVREVDRGNGQIALMTPRGAMLIDGPAAVLTFNRTPTITPDMTFASGALSGVSLNGKPLSLTDGFGRLGGGSLGAAFTLRDQTLVTMQEGLDTVALDLVNRFADPAVDTTLTIGDAGLLTDGGSAYSSLNFVGLSGRLQINAAVDPTGGGDMSRLRDGMNATTAGPVGNGVQLDRWLGALRSSQSVTTGSTMRNAAGQVAEFTAGIGAARLSVEEELSFDIARWETLRSTELSKGVDSDQELQLLLRIEQSYAANARVMQTVDAMIQRLMEI